MRAAVAKRFPNLSASHAGAIAQMGPDAERFRKKSRSWIGQGIA